MHLKSACQVQILWSELTATTVVLSGVGRPLEAGEIRVQCWVCVCGGSSCDPGGPWDTGSASLERECALRMTSVRCVCDMFSRCKKDGPVPRPSPEMFQIFSLYAPATKPCSPAHIRARPVLLQSVTLSLLPDNSELAPSLSHDRQTAVCPRRARGFSCGSAIVGGVRRGLLSAQPPLSAGHRPLLLLGADGKPLQLGGTRASPSAWPGRQGAAPGAAGGFGAAGGLALLEVLALVWRRLLSGGFRGSAGGLRRCWLPSLPCWRRIQEVTINRAY